MKTPITKSIASMTAGPDKGQRVQDARLLDGEIALPIICPFRPRLSLL